MKLTKERKLYVGILALAGIGLLVDRLFLAPEDAPSNPSSAAAAAIPTRPPVVVPSASTGAAKPAESAGRPSCADRLAKVGRSLPADLSDLRDAFRPSAAWCAAIKTAAPSPSPQQPDKPTFGQQHQLTAVVVDGKGGKAIVDGRCLEVGDQLDGFTLVSVGTKTAVFTNGDVRLVLALPEAKRASAGAQAAESDHE